jgi:hypothetical protein
MFDFSRRFTIADPSLAGAIAAADGVPTDVMLAASSSFLVIARAVRLYSILLTNAKYVDIYRILTRDADPEIGYILLAAQRDDQSARYTIAQVESMLWGSSALPIYSDFAQGLTEVAIKFTAAVMIGAFATQTDQKNMAEFLRKDALATLDRIAVLAARTTSAVAVDSTALVNSERIKEARFYFDPVEITLASDLTVSFFIPNFVTSPDWSLAATYPAGTTIHTRKIAADIALAINRYTLSPSNSSNIIAAVSQSGQNSYPYIDFALREYVAGYNGDLVSVQFEQLTGQAKNLPFKWGVETNDLQATFINSCLLLLRTPKSTTLSTITSSATASKIGEYNVLYFRSKKPTALDPTPQPTGDLSYRLSVTETINRVAAPSNSNSPRYSQQAVALMNGLQALTTTTKLLGCIVRDDLITESAPMAAVELIAWSVTSPITYLILDILTVPADIEIALGDLRSPQTTFSNLPLTIVCKPLYEKALGTTSTTTTALNAGQTVEIAQIGSGSQSILRESLREKIQNVTGYNYN